MNLRLKRLSKNAQPPEYATNEAAGMDITSIENVTIKPGEFYAVSTGIALELPEGTEVQVRPRSGLAFKHGVTVLNAPGTIDSDYRGEIKVLLINHGNEPFDIREGDRIAQLVISSVVRVTEVHVVTGALSSSERGTNGLGSSGIQGRPSIPKGPTTKISVAPEPTEMRTDPSNIKNYTVKNSWEGKIAINSIIVDKAISTNTTLAVKLEGKPGTMLLTPKDLQVLMLMEGKKEYQDKYSDGVYKLRYYSWSPNAE